MLEIRNTEVVGLERSLRASGIPMTIGEINTKLDLYDVVAGGTSEDGFQKYINRGKKLGSAPVGSGHDNFLSGIDVYYDVKYSLYWSPEFQRYHFNQIISSQSKMHKLTSMGKDFEQFKSMFNKYVKNEAILRVYQLIYEYNNWSEDKDKDEKYELFMKIISNLPAGFEQWMTIKTNYLQLKTMYLQRKSHKLKEDWGEFCSWCLTLPYFKELTGVEDDTKK